MCQQVLILPANGYGQWPKYVAVIYKYIKKNYCNISVKNLFILINWTVDV